MAERNASTPAEAAKQIRKKLREAGIEARVTSQSRGTSSVRVQMWNQPPERARKAERIAGEHRMGRFDGMTDSYDVDNARSDLPQARYVHIDNTPSEEMNEEIRTYAKERHGEDSQFALHRIYTGQSPYGTRFWEQREKPARTSG